MAKNNGIPAWWGRLPDTGAFLIVVICTGLFLYFVMRDTQGPRYSGGKIATTASQTNAPEPLTESGRESTPFDELGIEPEYLEVEATAVAPEQVTPYIKYVEVREFEAEVLAEGLQSPDGVACHLASGAIYVSEEDASTIRDVDRDRVAVDRDTPVTFEQMGVRRTVAGLTLPEGIAFDPDGFLYAVEDRPGGRLIRYTLGDDGIATEGEVVPIPGHWQDFAWEGVACGPDGRLLVVGSNIEQAAASEGSPIFLGALIYRDALGQWWAPQERLFSSFSSVAFSRSGRYAVYVCEVTGAIGWVDLLSSQPLGGNSALTAQAPEGLCLLPDGGLLVAEEKGVIRSVHPGTDETLLVADLGTTIESVWWDDANGRALVTDDGGGRLLALTPDIPFPTDRDLMSFARVHPLKSLVHVPERCPDYLAQVIALGGLDFQSPLGTPLSFRRFVQRVPMVSADAVATPIEGLVQSDDPVERVQLVVFEPNTLFLEGTVPTTALAGFYARMRSGLTWKTTVKTMATGFAASPVTEFADTGTTTIVVPNASSVSVSAGGISTIQFLGLGHTPDFALTLNPLRPDDSYLVVFHPDGKRDQYRLQIPGPRMDPAQWVLAYSQQVMDAWKPLHDVPGLVQSLSIPL